MCVLVFNLCEMYQSHINCLPHNIEPTEKQVKVLVKSLAKIVICTWPAKDLNGVFDIRAILLHT